MNSVVVVVVDYRKVIKLMITEYSLKKNLTSYLTTLF